ncbi:GFA family protein [Microbulbifer sp. VTAC004]|uniref:GFA family protein n=1 Tax=Microbulbifer sp. VTAC004 TaxID=3243386 RepID=UPI0040396761
MSVNIKEVDGVKIQLKHRASCHCGSVEIELDLPEGLIDLRRCDCSMCRRRGAVDASVSLNGIKILKGEQHLKLYQFNKRTAIHYFCEKCGIYTHHKRRSNPRQFGSMWDAWRV